MSRLLIFDLDGTLVDSKASILSSIRFALQETGYSHLEFNESLAVQQDLGTTFRAATERAQLALDEAKLQIFIETYRKHHSQNPAETMKAYDGIHDLLLRLHEDFQLAVATTKHSPQARHILGQLGLSEYFDHIQGTDPGMRYKPAPDILNIVLEKLERDPEESLYVGDSPHDMEAAHSARMMAVGAAYGFAGKESLETAKPHAWLHSPQDLYGVLEIERIAPIRFPLRGRPSARRTRTAWTAAQLAMRSRGR